MHFDCWSDPWLCRTYCLPFVLKLVCLFVTMVTFTLGRSFGQFCPSLAYQRKSFSHGWNERLVHCNDLQLSSISCSWLPVRCLDSGKGFDLAIWWNLSTDRTSNFPILCLAFLSVILSLWLLQVLVFLYCMLHSDPVGTSSPNLPTKERFHTMDGLLGHPLAIMCSAQANPPPNYR